MKTEDIAVRKNRFVKAVVVIAAAAILVTFVGRAGAYPKSMRKQMLRGPYEILVKKGLDGADLLFPVVILDPEKEQQFDQVLPVVGSSLKVKIERYLPDLGWEQYAEPSEDGGFVAKLRAVGPDINQEIWLDSGDISKQSITSTVGGMAIKGLRGKVKSEDGQAIMKQLVNADAVGLLSVWFNGSKFPLEYVVSVGAEITMPDKKSTFKVLRYLPHYSIDTETKEVKNASGNPYNPAIEVSFDDGKTNSTQWFYSRFPSHPHMESKIPCRVEFTAFDLGGKAGRYIIAAGDTLKPKMFWIKDGKKVMEELKFKSPYPMTKEGYHFEVEELFAGTTLKQRWKNNSDELVNPALVVSVGLDDDQRQLVLTLGKPEHVKFDSGTVVLLYKTKKPAVPEAAAAQATK